MDVIPSFSQPEVIVENIEELRRWLLKGVTVALTADAHLKAPLSHLFIFTHSDGKEASFAALIFTKLPSVGGLVQSLTTPNQLIFQPPLAALASEFVAVSEDKALYILDTTGRRSTVVTQGLLPTQISVIVGDWPLYQWVTPAIPITDPFRFTERLQQFCTVLSTTLRNVYVERDTPPPIQHIVLRIPHTEPQGMAHDISQQLESAFRRFIPRSPPIAQEIPTDMPSDRFSDVGGQKAAVEGLGMVLLALSNPERYQQWGVRAPKGVLLYGPPGTGKTLLARCLAGEARAHFFHVRVSDITSKWYGEAESRMRTVFRQARAASPSIVFFDELDALAPSREGAHEASQRILSTLLDQLDGLEELRGVIVVGATNRIGAIDPALLRPGRFDRLIEVGLPNREDRRAILEIHCRRAEDRAGRVLFAELGWERLLRATDTFSGAELAEVVRRTLESRVISPAEGPITTEELLTSARAVRSENKQRVQNE